MFSLENILKDATDFSAPLKIQTQLGSLSYFKGTAKISMTAYRKVFNSVDNSFISPRFK